MSDVMWARPDGMRTLLVPNEQTGAFISSVYRFDGVTVTTPFSVTATKRSLDVITGELELQLQAGAGWRIPFRRPAWFTRLLEAPIARLTLGVRTYGVSPTGVREWYRADAWRPITMAKAALGGHDLGPLQARFGSPAHFGFSEPPRRPSIVEVRPLLSADLGCLPVCDAP
jgi:hypothetical protein